MRNADLARMIAASRRIKRIQIAMLWAYFDETVVNVAEKDGKLVAHGRDPVRRLVHRRACAH
jgi:hypothetical protein